jgi:hypothetical protein
VRLLEALTRPSGIRGTPWTHSDELGFLGSRGHGRRTGRVPNPGSASDGHIAPKMPRWVAIKVAPANNAQTEVRSPASR